MKWGIVGKMVWLPLKSREFGGLRDYLEHIPGYVPQLKVLLGEASPDYRVEVYLRDGSRDFYYETEEGYKHALQVLTD